MDGVGSLEDHKVFFFCSSVLGPVLWHFGNMCWLLLPRQLIWSRWSACGLDGCWRLYQLVLPCWRCPLWWKGVSRRKKKRGSLVECHWSISRSQQMRRPKYPLWPENPPGGAVAGFAGIQRSLEFLCSGCYHRFEEITSSPHYLHMLLYVRYSS